MSLAATDRHRRNARPSRWLALLQALAYAGALVDPSGVLAGQRAHQPREGR
jgi:hypothetical protein